MKIKALLLFLAVSSLFAVSCNKDNDDEQEPLTLEKNQLIIDNHKYDLKTSAVCFNNSYVQFAGLDKTNAALFSLGGGFYLEAFNSIFNAAVHNPDVHYYVDFYTSADGLFSVNYDNHEGSVGGGIGNTPYDDESVYKEGSVQIKFDDDGVYFAVDGTLKNDKRFGAMVFVPKDSIDFRNNR